MENELKEAKLTRYIVNLHDKTIVYGFDPEEAEEKPGAGYYFTCSVCNNGGEMMRGINEPLTGPELIELLDEHMKNSTVEEDQLKVIEAHKTKAGAGLSI